MCFVRSILVAVAFFASMFIVMTVLGNYMASAAPLFSITIVTGVVSLLGAVSATNNLGRRPVWETNLLRSILAILALYLSMCVVNNGLAGYVPKSLPLFLMTIAAGLVSFACVFVATKNLGRTSGERPARAGSAGRTRPDRNADLERYENPTHAIVEFTPLPFPRIVTAGDIASLQVAVNDAMLASDIDGVEPLKLEGKDSVALVDPEYGLMVWARCATEGRQIKVAVSYAERNKGSWRPKSQTNWAYDAARRERSAANSSFNQLDTWGLLLYIPHAIFAPRLSRVRSERAEEMKASFSGLLWSAVDEWQARSHLAPQPAVKPTEAKQQVRRRRE